MDKVKLDKVKELNILNKLAQALATSLDLNTILDVALDETMSNLRVNNGGIYLFNTETRKLTLQVQHNLTDAFIKAKSVVGPGEGCTGTAFNTKKIFSGFNTPQKNFICLDAKVLMGIDCLAAAPIIYKDQVIGVLELFAPVDRKLGRNELDLLDSICSQVGVAIANANSHQALKHALKSTRLLLEASETLVSSLKLNEILKRLIHLTSELTHISRAAIWLYHPKNHSLILSHDFESLNSGYALNLNAAGPLQKIIRKGKALKVDDFSQSAKEFIELADRLALKSLLAIPIVIRGRTLGLMTLDKPGIKHSFSREEIAMAQGIARQAAIAIENANAFKAQQVIAETLQQSFMTLEKPKFPEIELGVEYKSASVGALVGGDFYDFINLGNIFGFIVGDVSGKGIEASTLTGIVKNTLRALIFAGLTLDEVMLKTNNLLITQIGRNQFVTLFFGLLDIKTGNLQYCNAGHPAALHYSAAKKSVAGLAGNNPPIGIFADQKFKSRLRRLRPHDYLLTYTDGVIEARHDQKLFGEKRLERLFRKYIVKDAQGIATNLFKDVDKFNRHLLLDDIALVVLKFKGEK